MVDFGYMLLLAFFAKFDKAEVKRNAVSVRETVVFRTVKFQENPAVIHWQIPRKPSLIKIYKLYLFSVSEFFKCFKPCFCLVVTAFIPLVSQAFAGSFVQIALS